MPRLLDRINFPRLVVILASTFGIALGACGLTLLASRTAAGAGMLPLGLFELAVMILSSTALVLSVLLWIVVSIFGDRTSRGSEPQRLFGNSANDQDQKQ